MLYYATNKQVYCKCYMQPKRIVKNAKTLYDNNIFKTKRYVKCSQYVINNRLKIYDLCFFQTSISTFADLSTDIFLVKSYEHYDIRHFILQHLLTWLLTSSFYLIWDIYNEFNSCEKMICEKENCDL